VSVTQAEYVAPFENLTSPDRDETQSLAREYRPSSRFCVVATQ
jgi:hypothetical protein